MSKNKKSRAKHAPVASAPKPAHPPLMLGSFRVPAFDGMDAAFGAAQDQYPAPSLVPEVDRRYRDAFSTLFFSGGKLADFGLELKPGLDRARAMTALRAWMGSFAPKHEHKEATVAWALSEWCQNVQAPAETDSHEQATGDA